ncbi:MAG: hypothetical protein QOD03_117, partial [Verrucomicrobiota bacterium]
MKKLSLFAIGALLCSGAWAQTPAVDTSSADKLGWQLAVHSYTFQKFPIFEAIDRTAALGIKYMSVSGTVSFDGTNKVSTVNLSEKNREAIEQKLKA